MNFFLFFKSLLYRSSWTKLLRKVDAVGKICFRVRCRDGCFCCCCYQTAADAGWRLCSAALSAAACASHWLWLASESSWRLVGFLIVAVGRFLSFCIQAGSDILDFIAPPELIFSPHNNTEQHHSAT